MRRNPYGDDFDRFAPSVRRHLDPITPPKPNRPDTDAEKHPTKEPQNQ